MATGYMLAFVISVVLARVQIHNLSASSFY